jgi:hypothetical protein
MLSVRPRICRTTDMATCWLGAVVLSFVEIDLHAVVIKENEL